MTLPGINLQNYDTLNATAFIDAIQIHGPSRPNVGSVGALKNANTVKRRFVRVASQTTPGTAELRQGDDELFVKYRGLPGWGEVDSAGHFGELALIAPDANGDYHAWTIEHLRHPVETSQTSVFKFDADPDIWTTAFNSKTHSPFKGTGYQPPKNALCGLCITGLAGAIRTNILPFLFPADGGGGETPEPASWLGDVVGPQIAMSPDPDNLARMSNEQIDTWAQDLLVEHGFDGIDLWLLGQEVNASTVRLLSHPACRIVRVVMWTDTDRGGPSVFDDTATRDYLTRILRATRGTGATLLVEPSFDVNEIPDHRQRVAEFVAMAKGIAPGLQGSATWLFGARQHDSPQPLPGDYAAWGDHVTDKAAWAQMCRTTLERAGGLPAGQTDRFRSRSGSTRSKDWPTGEMPDGIRTARRFGVLCSWGFLPDGNHEVGSRPWPNKGEIAAANKASPDDIDDGGGLVARRPKDLLHPWIRVDPAHSAGKDRDRFALTDDPEGRFVAKGWDEPIIVEEVEFWVGCWPEALNEFAVGFHVNRKNVAEFSGHKHYRFTPPSGGGTFTSGHGGQGGVYRDRERVVLPVPLLVKPSEDVIQVSYGQHPEHANHPNGGTHYRVIVRGKKAN